ncbi:MAG: hypothetical protein ACJA0V_001706 [Planctomycetota bacterium]|jgi:hypothetical protein
MGHIVFAAPSISRFHLHHRLRRDLLRRGHRVSILCTDRCRFTFWRAQVSDVDLVEASRRKECPAAMLELIEQVQAPEARRQLVGLAPVISDWFEREQPDLVLFHDERSAAAACMQFAARVIGSKVLWTGQGLLPHTMQVDERGLDADASCRRWQAKDFSVVTPDKALLDAALTHALAGGEPLALPHAPVQVPLLSRRLADALGYLLRGRLKTARTALHGWRAPFASEQLVAMAAPLPDIKTPFVAVLLQHAKDPRVVLDASSPPDARTLVQHALLAADTMGRDTQVVAVLPDHAIENQLGAHALAGKHSHRVRIAAPSNAAVLVSTAAATITINHPAATIALLAGTPVIHLGRAIYGLRGVTTNTTLEGLPEAIAASQKIDRKALRQRFLTWTFQHGHVWCSATAPNHNGMLGLVQAVERRLQGDAESNTRPLPYRPGPTWPLAAT